MIQLKKIMLENGISISSLTRETEIKSLLLKLNKKIDFSIKDLEEIKELLIREKIIDDNCDTGELLKEID